MATDAKGELPFKLNDADLLHFDSYVNGEFVPSKAGARFDITDPGSGKVWGSCPDCTTDDVEPAVQAAYAAFQSWSKTTPRHRAQRLLAWHQAIVAAKEDLARILVHETGKPYAEAIGEIDYATTFTWWFVGEAERGHGSTLNSAIGGRRALVIKQPIGVAAALVPWNFPIALAVRKAAAALAAGCTMIVKTSPETPLTAVALAHLALKAGIPKGALNVLTTSLDNTPSVAEALCLHPLIKKVSFTGSTRVGKIISGLCARNLKKTTLELGGNCPFIVFDDANIKQTMPQLMALKWRHAGQACITSNRVYVQSGIYDKFVEELVSQTKAIRLGHGMDEGVTMGALTTPRNLSKAEELYEDAVAKGAKTVLGNGKREDRGGYFMSPTIVTGATDEMLMTHEEIFAPVLGVYRFETEEEVTRRANDTPLGLSSYVFTKNVDRLWRMFENLEAGMIGLVSVPRARAERNGRVADFFDLRRTRETAPRPSRRSEASRTAGTARRAARTMRWTSTSSPRRALWRSRTTFRLSTVMHSSVKLWAHKQVVQMRVRSPMILWNTVSSTSSPQLELSRSPSGPHATKDSLAITSNLFRCLLKACPPRTLPALGPLDGRTKTLPSSPSHSPCCLARNPSPRDSPRDAFPQSVGALASHHDPGESGAEVQLSPPPLRGAVSPASHHPEAPSAPSPPPLTTLAAHDAGMIIVEACIRVSHI